MNSLKKLLTTLVNLENPFFLSESYIVPEKGDMSQDFARLVLDFRPVYGDLTKVANRELAKHV